MVEFPSIPTNIIFHGDKDAGKKYIGFGKKRFSDLVTSLRPNSIPTGFNRYTSQDGVRVDTMLIYGLSEIHIYVPPRVCPCDVSEYLCKCGEYFAEGVIVGVHPVGGYVEAAQLYTVDVCQDGGKQIKVGNCVSRDFHVFSIGERVWCCLDIREMIATPPYYRSAIGDDYRYSAAFGAAGSYYVDTGYSGFTYVGDDSVPGGIFKLTYASAIDHPYDQTTYVYNHLYKGFELSADAIYPCEDIAIEDRDYIIPTMCKLSSDITSCAWLCNAQVGYAVNKDKYSITSEYTMLATIGAGSVPEEPIYFFNLQIIPQWKI